MPRKIGKALVVGAGISGIRAALDLAETGYGVTLIDRAPHLGGVLRQLDYQFPTDRCGMCKMLPLVDRDAASQYCLRKGLFHENIDIRLSTELQAVEGEPGNLRATLHAKPRWVDPQRCIGCGECVPVCPVEVRDDFNAGLTARKAIYLPVPHAIPNPYIIDTTVCIRCGECEKVCPTGAVQLAEPERKKFRILVVDDELVVRDSLKEWLDVEGYFVDMAASGAEALQKLDETQFHLMLLDIKMPGMDGVELLEKAKAAHPDLLVVMMTAYATVETAVEAMKIGALDYLVKPFDPETLIPMVTQIYEDSRTAEGEVLEVGALVLCGGTDYFDPATGKNTYGYGVLPGVVTSLEFERIFSGTGPSAGRLVRPQDGRPVRRVAWIQCVGSRDLNTEADFCSNVCCMYAIKEARVARERSGNGLETTIFYMDMRTYGKTFQRYRDQAEQACGVRFERGRVHSVVFDEAAGDLVIRYADLDGRMQTSAQDMVVLAVGQRPARGSARLAEMLEIPLNQWGFGETRPFSQVRTDREGIFLGGSFAGLKDIAESVTQASAAALAASRTIHAAGGGLAPEADGRTEHRDVSHEPPRILAVLCTCNQTLGDAAHLEPLMTALLRDPAIDAVETVPAICTAESWQALEDLAKHHRPNRILIGACLPCVYARKLRTLSDRLGLDASLLDVVDIRSAAFDAETETTVDLQRCALQTAASRLKRVDPSPTEEAPIEQRALVIGGGIAGMTAALAVADHGYPVDLVEVSGELGGNLRWLRRTLEGSDPQALLDEVIQKVEKHPQIQLHLDSRLRSVTGQAGRFAATLEDAGGAVAVMRHGAIILATGGSEAQPQSYGYGSSANIVTQRELEEAVAAERIEPGGLGTVVMIQCADCREEPRNYCSRVCCASALKHALHLKEVNPEVNVYVLYRDMMTYGFSEAYFTEARRRGVTFIQYALSNKPEVHSNEAGVSVQVIEPILGRTVEIDADLVVLAAGIAPNLPADLADSLGIGRDTDGFFQEADAKWRPVDALKEGVFACGLVHSPRNIAESIATAEAAAQRSLRLLSRRSLPAGKVVARVHESLCSLCQRCIEVCPYGARSLDEEPEKVRVNALMCQGCGSCAAVCPNKASVLGNFLQEQMLETIDAALGCVWEKTGG
jgi:heterodisulfide reductase subunit A